MGLKRGDEVRVTIVEPFAGPSPPLLCAAELAEALMLAPGTELRGRVRGFSAGDDEISCTPALLDIEPVGDWTWTFSRADASASGAIGGRYEITNGQCTATTRLSVYDEKTDRLNVTLERGNESCPAPCSVTFVVRIDRA